MVGRYVEHWDTNAAGRLVLVAGYYEPIPAEDLSRVVAARQGGHREVDVA